MITNFAAFLVLSILVIAAPGQDTAITIRNTLVGGRSSGIATAAGVVSGLATWTVASSAGLAALIVASQPLFLAVRLIGAAYLVFLGLQALSGALHNSPSPVAREARGGGTAWRGFRQGLFSNLSNPKIVVFFLSLLPQFVSRTGSTFLALVFLGAIFCGITLGWLTVYAVVVARIGDVLRRDRIRRAIESVTGLILIVIGLRIATEQA